VDIVRKRGIKGGQGTNASEYSDIIARAGSWQYGTDVEYSAVEAEKKEEDDKFGGLNNFSGRAEEEHDPDGIRGGK
jgi:hypothetical protein